MKKSRMKKMVAGILTLGMVLPCGAVFGATKLEIYNELQKTLFSQKLCQTTQMGQQTKKDVVLTGALTQGIIGGELQDFDGDSQLELMTVGTEKNGTVQQVIINFYEYVGGQVNLSKTYVAGALPSAGFQKQECTVFIWKNYGKYYVCTQYQGAGTFGAKQEVAVLDYKEEKLDVKLTAKLEGAVVTGDSQEIAKNLESLGFTESAKVFGKGGFGYAFAENEPFMTGVAKVLLENGKGTVFDYTDMRKIKVLFNGEKVLLSDLPVIKDGRTLVPLRTIAETMGASVTWDSRTKRITLEKGDTTLHLFLEMKRAYLNGKETHLDVVPQIIGGKTYVPIRFISENLKGKVTWSAMGQTIEISN